jgi:hypothetical protein
MPYKLERWGDKAIVVNTKTGKHFSTTPLPEMTAKAQMRLLESKSKKEKK